MRTPALLAAAAVAAAVLVPAVAAAQPALTPVAPAPTTTTVDQPRELDPGVALGLSIGVTAAGFGAIALADAVDDDSTGVMLGLVGVGGVAFGPSVGHWYQGDLWTRGLGFRMVGTAAFIYGLSTVDFLCFDSCDHSDDDLGEVMLIGGMIAFVAGGVDDIVSAPYAANRRNREARARSGLQFTVAPRVTGKQAGLVLAGRF